MKTALESVVLGYWQCSRAVRLSHPDPYESGWYAERLKIIGHASPPRLRALANSTLDLIAGQHIAEMAR